MADMIRINDQISISEDEIQEQFIRSSGPGGQNVNKVSSAVDLRFDVRGSPSLTAPVRARLERLAGRRLTKDGILVLRADRFRTQDMNREDARTRLVDLIAQAAIAPKFRVKTKPTKASKERRLEGKDKRAKVKQMRRVKPGAD